MNLITSEKGQGLAEYSLIMSLIVLAVILVLSGFGSNLKLFYENRILGSMP